MRPAANDAGGAQLLAQVIPFPRPSGVASREPRRGPQGVEYWRACVDCGAEGWHPRLAPVFACAPCLERRRAQAAQLQRLAPVAEALASIPERHRAASLDSPDLARWVASPELIALAAQVAPLESPRVVLLTGATGAGKTTLGTAILRWHLDRGVAEGAAPEARAWATRCLWVPARSLAMARRQAPLGQEPALLVRAREASVLLVDDLGQESPQDKDDVIAVLSDRQADGRPTIVTWGWALGELSRRYSPHLQRRLCEGAALLDLGGL